MIDYNSLIKQELSGLYGQEVTKDMSEIIALYDFYEGKGQIWNTNDSELDYIPTKMITNFVKKLIKKEARFMFGRTPQINLKPLNKSSENAVGEIQNYISDILEVNSFQDKLIKGARDCFIGKRVALKLWGNKDDGIKVMFRPSLEFVFETDPEDIDTLEKIIFFYVQKDSENKTEQRIWKQKYEIVNGKCILNEGIYNGYGQLVEEKYTDYDTGLDFIPARVIINDGLTGDLKGESDVEELLDNQQGYNKLKSDDIDALKFNMFPIKSVSDADERTLKSLVIAPNAIADLQTEPTAPEGRKAEMKNVESTFNYDSRFENSINRIKNDMYDLLSIPNVSLEQLKGLMQSGKSMRALYWELIERCEEKWSSGWESTLKWMVDSIIKMTKLYKIESIPESEYKVHIEHLYPILEDEEEERKTDMEEVDTQVRSRKSYIKKWGINEDEDAELKQIAEEQDLLDNLRGMGIKAELGANNE